jgi:hypothetical protein
MNTEQLDSLVTKSQSRRRAILSRKGKDYDKEEDRLSSFREVASILNTLKTDGYSGHTASGIAQMLLILKLVRDANLKEGGTTPENESRQDTLDDAHNYLELYEACELDRGI